MKKATLQVVGLYALIAGLWIILSDQILGWIVTDHDRALYVWLQTYKGWGFVLVTSLLLYFAFIKQFKIIDQANSLNRQVTERLQHYLAVSPTISYALKIEGNQNVPIWVSDNVVNQLGYAVEEALMPEWWADHIHPDDRERVQKSLSILYETDILDVEYRFSRKDGSIIWTQDQLRLVRDEDGRPKEIIGAWIDITQRKRAEDAVRESEEKYRILLEESPDPIFSFTSEGQYRYVNRAFAEGVGKPVNEIIGNKVWDVFPKDEADKRFAVLSEVFRTGQEKVFDVRVPRSDGDLFYVTTVTPVKNVNGEIISALCSSKNITERKKTEERMNEISELYRAIVESQEDAICRWRPDTTLTFANAHYIEVFGVKEQEVGRVRWIDFVPESERESTRSFCRILAEKPKKHEHDQTVKLKDGTHRHYHWVDMPLFDNQGNLREFQSVGRDITEGKEAEIRIRNSEKFLSEIIDFLPDATLVIDKEGKVIAWNKAIEAMTGIRKEVILGKGNRAYSIPFYNDNRPILIDLVLRPDPEAERQYTTIRRQGDTIFGEAYTSNLPRGNVHLSATASVLRDSKGEIIAAIECVRDNTERKRLEESLARAEKMEALGTLAGGVAHDLNNVLGVLVGYSELLAEKLPAESSMRKHADNIMKSSIRGAAIIQDLLTLARRGVTISEVVDLNQVIGEYLKSPEFEKMMSYHHGVTVKTNLAGDLFHIKGSPVHLGKVVMNLMSNAAEAISGMGAVSIRTENRYIDKPVQGYDDIREGDYVILTVTDTGKGISTQDIGKIFEPFYTKKVMGRSGTGLGLAVVWGTVRDHRGYIDVQSAEGEGATFTVYFPVTREEPAGFKEKVSIAEYTGKGESILVVDDVREQRELAKSMLEKLGYRVDTVSGGEEAIAYLNRKKTDLVVLDMIMDPGIDGLETYQRILAINPEQKAIIVSGFSETERVKKAQETGAGTFVRKPYVKEKIGLAVRRELDRE
jgi:PAS domain S-box-containing protein